jgi:methionyl-tRNA synthetase
MAERFYVTTPIYYVNDVPHLGTAYTTIAADVLTRYHRVRGRRSLFLTGTDEHGLKIARVAKERGLSPKAFADEMNEPFREAWPALGCVYDHFIRTTDPEHERKVQAIWQKVRDKGDLYLGAYEGWYCVGCEAYYTEKELEPGGICPVHKAPAERVKEPSYFFRLSAYQDRLLALYEKNPSFVLPEVRMNEVKSFVRAGLEDLSVSRTTFTWGIPVPGDPAHVMYVWFDALFSYFTPLYQSAELEAFWPATIHLVGKDILRFHAVYWPAFLLAAGLSEAELPKHVFAHGWLTFNGQKMSKTLRNTVKPLALAQAFGSDTLRYYLMRAIAFGQDGDFNVKDLVTRYNAELGNAFGNLLNRVLTQCVKVTGGVLPERGAPHELDGVLERSLLEGARVVAEAFEAVQPHRALEAIWAVIAATNQYIDKAAPWAAIKKGDTARAGTIFRAALDVVEAISVMAWPVLPHACDAARAQIGLPPVGPEVDKDMWPLAPPARAAGQRLGTPVPLFPKIDAAKEEELVRSLGLDAKPQVQGVATISYDDFAKMDLRVAKVLSAERIVRKDKLLLLKIDAGDPEPRTILAGIALSYKPEELVGKRIVVVANLEPRSFGKGLVSNGMLLAAGPAEALKLVMVDEAIAPGTRVK